MAENSKIEWTTHTFNPWWGCTKVAAGCTHCYAEAFAKRTGKAKWGDAGTRVLMSADYWKQPDRWNKAAQKSGRRARVFCASMADVFEDWQGEVANKDNSHTMDFVRRGLFALIDQTPHLDWLLLTKRPENIRRMWPMRDDKGAANFPDRVNLHPDYRQNVWLLTSVAEQKDADANVPHLLACRDLVPVLGLSCEPLIGPMDLSYALPSSDGFVATKEGPIHIDDGAAHIDWIIVGGESGHGARPCDLAWLRGIRDQCKCAGVPVFVKQLGSRVRMSFDEWNDLTNGGSTGSDRFVLPKEGDREFGVWQPADKKGGEWNEWPSDLKVREFPCQQN